MILANVLDNFGKLHYKISNCFSKKILFSSFYSSDEVGGVVCLQVFSWFRFESYINNISQHRNKRGSLLRKSKFHKELESYSEKFHDQLLSLTYAC